MPTTTVALTGRRKQPTSPARQDLVRRHSLDSRQFISGRPSFHPYVHLRVMINCPKCNEENPPKFRLCGYCGAPLTPAAAPLPVHGPTDRHDHLLRPEGLDRARRAPRPRGAARGQGALLHGHGGRDHAPRRQDREVHRRRDHGRVRPAAAARGRRAARRARRRRHAARRCASVNEDLRRATASTLANRTGVNTGEVVANDDPTADQKLATGDAVNVAARLEQAAPANEIYLGDTTYRLVRDAVEVEAVEPLELKGKSERVAGLPAGVGARASTATRGAHDTPDRRPRRGARGDRPGAARGRARRGSARLVTVIGDAGIGKSRLVARGHRRVAGAARACVRGRCLPYGDGITFWPLREMVSEAADIRVDDTPGGSARQAAALPSATPTSPRAWPRRSASAPAAFPLHEIYWAARKFLETLAADGPAGRADRRHPLGRAGVPRPARARARRGRRTRRSCCSRTARHDLLEKRPQWGERAGVAAPRAAPAERRRGRAAWSPTCSARPGLPPDVVARIVAAAEGNPLYVEQMLSMLVDSGALRAATTAAGCAADELRRDRRAADDQGAARGAARPARRATSARRSSRRR